MVWLLTQNSESLRYLPKIIEKPRRPDPKTKAAYRDEHGFVPNGIHAGGHAVEDRFWPDSGRFEDDVEIVPRILGAGSFYLIPESWRDVIEEFEPSVHQFKHIPLTLKDGTPLEERFYAMNIRQALTDAADRERSTAPGKKYADGRFAFVKTGDSKRKKIYFFKDKVKKYHLWCPRETIIYNIAVSNELFERIAQLGGMETVQALQIEEV